ncbi:hypothetical protein CJ030_MR7G017774 [Morella rubra]|uniref:Wall-associated receptor kinase galacturonan-binding domain-containing protein n=1 Tax=Morella rubra TaxID=262757 RepID=A0A6A1UYX4_9ROSI|nr:hypothetical protein CJ030_MR7G017771 [Morella rubra]KAB1205602.1 hypothetical protein CJ030_MR7G017774 [Morella rubra]
MHPTVLPSSSSLLFLIVGFAFLDFSTPLYYNSMTNTTYIFQDGQSPKDCDGLGLELMCQEGHPVIDQDMLEEYIVLQIKENEQVLTIVDKDIFHTGCPKKLVNTTFHTHDDLFGFASSTGNLTFLYNCTAGIPDWVPSSSNCRGNGGSTEGFYTTTQQTNSTHIPSCNSTIEIPIQKAHPLILELNLLAKRGFDLRYRGDLACSRFQGHCEYGWSQEYLARTCVCYNHPNPASPPKRGTHPSSDLICTNCMSCI